jgi:single-stranded DNA-binding protein
VAGKIRKRNYEDKEGVRKYVIEIIADNIYLLDKKRLYRVFIGAYFVLSI